MKLTNMRCTKCDAPWRTCDCWTECRCGWSYPTGTACRNPLHTVEKAAQAMADDVALCVLSAAANAYPEPMKHASGGFRKTLKAILVREVRDAVLHWMMAKNEATQEEIAKVAGRG